MLWIIIFGSVGLILLGIWIYLMVIEYRPSNKSPIEHLENVPGRYNPNANRFAKRRAYSDSVQNVELTASYQSEMRNLVEMMKVQTEAIVEEFTQQLVVARGQMHFTQEVSGHRVMLATHERDMALFENEKLVIAEANRLGLPVAAMNELKLEEAKLRMRLFEQEQTTRMELTAADFLELTPYQQVELLNGRLEKLRRKRYELSIGYDPPEVRDPLLKRYDKNIKALEKDIDARQKRLLQAQNG
jgi:hypothetical protein